jgi:hypothetical protein
MQKQPHKHNIQSSQNYLEIGIDPRKVHICDSFLSLILKFSMLCFPCLTFASKKLAPDVVTVVQQHMQNQTIHRATTVLPNYRFSLPHFCFQELTKCPEVRFRDIRFINVRRVTKRRIISKQITLLHGQRSRHLERFMRVDESDNSRHHQ